MTKLTKTRKKFVGDFKQHMRNRGHYHGSLLDLKIAKWSPSKVSRMKKVMKQQNKIDRESLELHNKLVKASRK